MYDMMQHRFTASEPENLLRRNSDMSSIGCGIRSWRLTNSHPNTRPVTMPMAPGHPVTAASLMP